MPDRYGEEPAAADDREFRAQLRAIAIAECDLCDDNGYRGARVCDHVDHSEAAQRGMSAIRAQMGWDGRKVAEDCAQPQQSATGGES